MMLWPPEPMLKVGIDERDVQPLAVGHRRDTARAAAPARSAARARRRRSAVARRAARARAAARDACGAGAARSRRRPSSESARWTRGPAARRRASRARRTPCGRCGGATERAVQRARLRSTPALAHVPPVGAPPGRGCRAAVERSADRLDVADRLAQAAVLVEVAAHELDRRVVVRVQDGGAGVVGLAPARVRGERAAERLVLAVARRRRSGSPPSTRAGRRRSRSTGTSGRRAEDARLRRRRWRRTRSARARSSGSCPARGRCGPKTAPTSLGERERLAHGGEPAGRRRGVLGQEGDHVAARALGAEVARAAVPELRGRDLDHAWRRRRARSPASRRASRSR